MNNKLYELEGNPGFLQVLPFAIQQILTLFVSNLVPIGLVCAAASPAIENAQVLRLLQSAMIAAGIATIIQATPLGVIGSGLPIFMGVSFTFVVPLCAIASQYGYGAVTGTVIVGGIFEGLLGLTVKYWKRFISPIVSGVVVAGIGLSLMPTAARSFGGGYVEDFGSTENLLIGFITLVGSILWLILSKGIKKEFAILVGICVGYIAAVCLGKIDFSGLTEGGFFALPTILPFKPEFHMDAILSIAIIYLVSATETLGDSSAIAGGVLNRPMTKEEMRGALTVDGFGSAISGLLGGTPVTSFSENVGLCIMTKVINRNVARVGGLLLIICGLFPPIGWFVNTIPNSVLGAGLLVLMGQILVSGIDMISQAGFTEKNKLIVALSLSIAVGFTTSTEAGIWNRFPAVIQGIFSQNVVAVIFVVALVLNIVLPKSLDS